MTAKLAHTIGTAPKPLTEQEEAVLHRLQAEASRLDTDDAFSELNRYVRYLERQGK